MLACVATRASSDGSAGASFCGVGTVWDGRLCVGADSASEGVEHIVSDVNPACDCGCGALVGAGLLFGAAAFFCVSKMLCGSKREKKGSLTAEPGGDGIYADEAL